MKTVVGVRDPQSCAGAASVLEMAFSSHGDAGNKTRRKAARLLHSSPERPGDLCRNRAFGAHHGDETVFSPSAAHVPALAHEAAGETTAPPSSCPGLLWARLLPQNLLAVPRVGTTAPHGRGADRFGESKRLGMSKEQAARDEQREGLRDLAASGRAGAPLSRVALPSRQATTADEALQRGVEAFPAYVKRGLSLPRS